MKRRIIAWCLLIGFVLLLLNILIFKKFLQASFFVYIVICAYFLMTRNQKSY
ncbi:hypothetical protein Clocl_1841 [Acetivibrio clariflavus DSM 19732]|uniref:Uncharacterized protein n=1 Tax=Acetivibrio clariflavus (strain DSM 19732 / NBRC 101661 / EBR45) TaxID=720554 RepID=G8LU62_ACECE|nr:hypothetical protein Clocl_1841 [Acetivibrio clariflavus DSM 19732]